MDVSDESLGPSLDVMPVDVGWVRDTVTEVQCMRLGTTKRAEIDARTKDLVNHLRELLSQDLGADDDPEVMQLCREVYRHLDLQRRPNQGTTVVGAFEFMQKASTLAFGLMKAYTKKHGPEPEDS